MAFGRSYGTLMTIKFEVLFVTTLALPLVSLVICVFLALYNEYDRAVATHCQVSCASDDLPSIQWVLAVLTGVASIDSLILYNPIWFAK
jgi:hypothetical protein